jgi:hypothetical protein
LHIVASDDKRQITGVLSVTAAGELLPMQLIYKGKTENSCPNGSIKERMFNLGHRFSLNPKNHWSSEATMKEFVWKILRPYYLQVIKRKGLPEGTKLVWLIDCWSVHRKTEFKDWLKETHGTWLVFLYVPANCTSECQPCDVILNRPFKAAFRTFFQKWMIDVTEENFSKGIEAPVSLKAKDIKNNSAKLNFVYLICFFCLTFLSHPPPPLICLFHCLLSVCVVRWLLETWTLINSQTEYLLKGWKKCGFDKLNDNKFLREAVLAVDANELLSELTRNAYANVEEENLQDVDIADDIPVIDVMRSCLGEEVNIESDDETESEDEEEAEDEEVNTHSSPNVVEVNGSMDTVHGDKYVFVNLETFNQQK